MQRTKVREETAAAGMAEAETVREDRYPVSPLSIRRDKPVEDFFKVLSGTRIWAGAFMDGGRAFRSMRFETIAEAGLPYFLYTIRGGHLFSSCAPFAFPLDLLPAYGPPGELTILSTGKIVATLRLVRTSRAGVGRILQRDSEFSRVLIARLQRPENGVRQASFQMPP